MAARNDKKVLETQLANLLGFDDGAADVLEHLITIDDKEDMSEYLSQLLGDRSAQVELFADNVHRYQQGQRLTYSHTVGSLQAPAASASNAPSATLTTQPPKKPPSTATATTQNKKSASKSQARRKAQSDGNKQVRSRVPPPKKQSKATSPAPVAQRTVEPAVGDNTGPSHIAVQQPAEPKASSKNVDSQPRIEKTHPIKGTAKVDCGCFGSLHKPLTNCLYCGRIACVREGYGFCAFCGYEIRKITREDGVVSDEAWLHKERLLRFDREFAKRTQIFDDQADFQDKSMWMTEEEEAAAEEKNDARSKILQRKTPTMKLAL